MNKRNMLALLLVIAVVSGCGKDTPPGGGKQEERFTAASEATLNFFCGCDQAMSDFVTEQVKRKYPNIEFNTILISKENTLENVVAARTPLDVVYYSLGGVFLLKDLKLTTDYTPLIKKYNFDLNRLVPGAVETMESYSEQGKLEYMPLEQKSLAMFYNKSLFDKFAVPYPKDGMTWDEVLELARRLTRMDGGKQYYGINFNIQQQIYKDQLRLPFVDAATNKALLDTDGWRRWMGVMSSFFQIPAQTDVLTKNYILQFVKDQDLAMFIGTNLMGRGDFQEAVKNGMQWDVVSMPNFPGVQGGQLNTSLLTISEASPNKDAAFMVAETMLSDEAQAFQARKGFIPIVSSEAAKNAFAGDASFAAGKNLNALFLDPIAPPIVSTRYDDQAKNQILIEAFREIATGLKDSATALREAQERLNQHIESVK